MGGSIFKVRCQTVFWVFFSKNHYAPVSQANWLNMNFTTGNLFISHSCIGWPEPSPWIQTWVPRLKRRQLTNWAILPPWWQTVTWNGSLAHKWISECFNIWLRYGYIRKIFFIEQDIYFTHTMWFVKVSGDHHYFRKEVGWRLGVKEIWHPLMEGGWNISGKFWRGWGW